MTPAAWPRGAPQRDRLLLVDPRTGALADAHIQDLPERLTPGDLVVVNDAATLPASLSGRGPASQPLELRLAGEREDGGWDAVVFGDGDWRTRTEDRAAAPALAAGDVLAFGPGLSARVEAVDGDTRRLVSVRFDQGGPQFWTALYRVGQPIQYAYLRGTLSLWHVQTAFASRPWAAELPSAGRPLVGAVLAKLAARGIRVATLTHAAGLSSTGDPALDARLPLPERFDIPAATASAVEEAGAGARRVIAVGTTVVRALEGAAVQGHGRVRAGQGVTDLRIGAGHRLQVVDGVLTGVHQPGESHFELLAAFAPGHVLRRAVAHAEARGYLAHEFGDSLLIL